MKVQITKNKHGNASLVSFLPDSSGFELIDILQDFNFRYCLKINWNCFYKKSPQRLATLHKSIMQWEYKIGNMSSHPIGFLYFLILDVGCLLAKLRFLVSEFTIALSYLFEFFQHNQYRAYSNMNEYIYLRLRNLFRRENVKYSDETQSNISSSPFVWLGFILFQGCAKAGSRYPYWILRNQIYSDGN